MEQRKQRNAGLKNGLTFYDLYSSRECIEMDFLKRSWCEINLEALKNNYQCYKEKIQPNTQIMAVVKADAYGHGAVPVAETLNKISVHDFAVSNILEAIELRKAGIEGQILILGYTPIEWGEYLVQYDITQALLSEKYAEELITTGLKIKCQFAIDTGMNRIGLDAKNPFSCEKTVRMAFASSLNLNGLFTHLCVADTPSEQNFTRQQVKKFDDVVARVRDLKLPFIHCLNSAGGLWVQGSNSCYARLGIILYGLKPSYLNVLPIEIKPVLEWKSVISMIKTVHPGETIGYGRTYKVKENMKIATISTGYADGYNRLLSNKGYVLLYGKKAPIVGRICMDQFMIDVTNIPEAKLYDEVILIGKSGNEILTADDMAEMLETIGYEVVCDISKRVPRLYINETSS